MPVEFVHDVNDADVACKLVMAYDGSGRRISKTRYAKHDQFGYWTRNVVTHYTGIGTEVREAMRRSASPKTTVVFNLPQGLGRYMPEDAVDGLNGVSGSQLAGYRPPAKFEWYLKNHIGSTMLVYGTSAYSDPLVSGYKDGVKAAYDYRAFGEQVDLTVPAEKVTENFTGKEKDDETELNYFGARYLDPMLGMWISVDPARQFSSPYLYAGNGYNPVNGVDPDGNELDELGMSIYNQLEKKGFFGSSILRQDWNEMKNSEDLISFKYSKMDDAGQAYRNLKLIEINSRYKNNLVMTAITGRHEGDHLKGESGAGWHNGPIGMLFEGIRGFGDLLNINAGLRDNSLSNELLDALKSKEYDPIYGRDYDALQQIQEWKNQNEINE